MMVSIRVLASLFLATALILLPARGNAKAPAEHPQVIVVGAGMAGMIAALSLAQKGIDVVLLEKADTVGGRVYSHRLGGVAVNLGAQFYFPGIHPMIDEYFKSLPVQEIHAGGFFWKGKLETAEGDSYAPKAAARDIDLAVQQMKRDFQEAVKNKKFFFDREPRNKEWDELDRVSAAEYLSKFPRDVYEFFKIETGSETGADLGSLSAILLVGWNGDVKQGRFLLQGGNAALLEKMKADYLKAGGRILLNSEVSRVSRTPSSVVVQCADGKSYTADYAIMATPAYVTKETVSGLPAKKARALGAVKYVPMIELGLQLNNFPKDSFLVWDEPINGIINQTGPVAGEPAKGTVVSITITDPIMLKLGDAALMERAAVVLKKISPAFDPATDILDYSIKRWRKGVFDLAPSFLSKYQKDLRAPVGRIFFAGDYLYDASLMGAAWAGSRAADGIIKAMGPHGAAPPSR